MPCDNLPPPTEPAVCEKDGSALFLPIGGNAEHGWPKELRAVLYLLGLLWCFCGVAIVADIFMAAIEKITSKKVLVYDKKLKKPRTLSVWNPTVANLTLMALGSSAPEILLNVIGIFSDQFVAGELGPSTIVGSAAFNLLVIIGVCIVSIPNGEIRKIKDMGVFTVTGSFSIFAYVWLLVILLFISKDVVEWWEGVVTFAFFWVLVIAAFLADTGKLPGCNKPEASYVVHPKTTTEELAKMELTVRKKYGKNVNLTPDQVSSLIEYEFAEQPSRATLRVDATRAMFGGKRIFQGAISSRFEAGAKLAIQLAADGLKADEIIANHTHKTVVQFHALNYTVLESVGFVEVSVEAGGLPLQEQIEVKYATKADTATAGEDYEAISGVLKFGPGVTEQTFRVNIVKSEGYEQTEQFFVDLEGPGSHSNAPWVLGKRHRVTIVIIDEDHAGVLSFDEEQVNLEKTPEDFKKEITVKRRQGSTGRVTCKVWTESDSALEGSDFEPLNKELVFGAGQTEASFVLDIKANHKHEHTEKFRVVMKDATGGASFDNTTDGGSEACVLTVFLHTNEDQKHFMDKVGQLLTVNRDLIKLGNASYKEQFIAAFWVGGSRDASKHASIPEIAMHIVSAPWKLLFAVIPPTEYCGGWLCFSVALMMIGLVTCFIGDLAELLGCCLGISSGTTAITLVAVGTSLPDTFASKTSAQMDSTADNSIGNVTGSNSVNVFLGLGLPWMIASIYWSFVATCAPNDKWSLKYPEEAAMYPDGIFVVRAGALGTSVTIFTLCAIMCIGLLLIRRKVFGGELGGPRNPAFASAGLCVGLWVLYIVLSIVLGD